MSNDFGWVSGYYCFVRDIFDDDAAGTDDGAVTNGDAAQDGGVGADGGAFFDDGGDYFPIVFGLDAAGFGCGAGIAVIDEHHAVTDKNIVFDGDAFADKGMALDLAVFADESIFLDFHERTHPGAVIDLAAIEVDEVV